MKQVKFTKIEWKNTLIIIPNTSEGLDLVFPIISIYQV